MTNPAISPDAVRIWNAFIEGLREDRYAEDQNVIIERRYSEGRADRWPELASELVRPKVDLIFGRHDPCGACRQKREQLGSD